MIWLLYLLSVLTFCFFLNLLIKGSSKKIVVLTILVVLVTPAQIDVGLNNYAPALFSFLFNSILEQNLSLRVLRPIFLSVSFCLFTYFLIRLIRRKSF